MPAPDRSGPLRDLRVLDFTVGTAGPLAGMMLADLGADVVKVEPETGDPGLEDSEFVVWNRGKRRVACDLSHAQERHELRRLLGSANLVLVGTSPGGITYEQLRKVAPTSNGNVWVVICPYLPSGTPWYGEQESAGLLFAEMGHSWGQASFEDVPVDCVFPIVPCMQGIWAATVGVAACLSMRRHRRPRTLFVGGAHAATLVSPGAFSGPMRQLTRPEGGPAGSLPNYRCYQCQDGEWLFLGAFSAPFITRALQALELGDLLDDPRIAGNPDRIRLEENFAWMVHEIAQRLLTKPRAFWLARLEEADVAAAPVLGSDGWLNHPQVSALGLRVDHLDEAGRRVVAPGLPIRFSLTPGRAGSPARRVGQLLRPADVWRGSQADSLVERAEATRDPYVLPLAGVRVLGLGTIIAGPYAATLLAELGAEVVKIERPPAGDEFRTVSGGRGRGGFEHYNRGQRGMVLDLGAAQGQQVLDGLLATSDVLVDNFRPGVLARLGLDWPGVNQKYPRIVAASISAFGEEGPLGRRPGFDPIIQAMSGIMATQAGMEAGSTPVFLNIPVNDVLTAAITALGVCAALFHRDRSGHGQQVHVTLAGATGLLQAGHLVEVDGVRRPLQGGRDFQGPSPLDRMYRAADGWVRFAGSWPRELYKLESCGLLPSGAPVGEEDQEAVQAAIAAAVATRPVAALLRLARKAKLAAGEVRTIAQVGADPVLRAAGVIEVSEAGAGHMLPGCWYEDQESSPSTSRAAPQLGQDTRSILTGINLSEGCVSKLFESGVVFGS